MIVNEYLRRLVDEATHGPWTAHEGVVGAEWSGASDWSGPVDDRTLVAEAGEADAEFIAAARTAVPALLAENATLVEKIKIVEEHRRYLMDKLAGANHRANNHEARAIQAEADRNSNAVALAQAVIRADKAEAQVRHLKDKYNEDMEQLRREHDGDMEVLTSRIQSVNDVIDRHVEILGFDAVVPVERLWKVLE